MDGLPNSVFWKLPPPPKKRNLNLCDVVEWEAPTDTEERARRNLGMIAPLHQTRLLKELTNGFRVAPGYKRTRAGKPVLELRFDGVAGCLRTPEGGSSRQLLVLKRDGKLTTRLLTARETARLMGAPEYYRLPGNYNEAYRAMGDAVAVPVARFLAQKLLLPLCNVIKKQMD
jgi:DNA (cytosine-5)-methyltransferase 1